MAFRCLAVPAYGLNKLVKLGHKHLKRKLFTYRKADAWLKNTTHRERLKKKMDNPKVVRSAIEKFTHKKLSVLSDEWIDIRKRYLLAKNIEGIVHAASKKFSGGKRIPFSQRPSCGDFILSFQQMVLVNNAYIGYQKDLDLFEAAYNAVENERKRAQINFIRHRQKIISEIKKWFYKDEVSQEILKSSVATAKRLNSDYHDRFCLKSKKLSKDHRICYHEGGNGKGYFDIKSVKKINGRKSKSEIARYKKLYRSHGVLRVLEDAAHSKQFRPHYKKLDFRHTFKSHNPKSQVMGNDMVRLLGYLDVLHFCTAKEDEPKDITREISAFLKEIQRPLAASICDGIRNILVNISSEALPGGFLSVDEVDASLGDAFDKIVMDRIKDPVDFSFDLFAVTFDITSELAGNIFSDVAQIGWEQTGEAFANFFSGGIFGLVKDCIEGSAGGISMGIASVVLNAFKISFNGFVIPVATTINKMNNLKSYEKTKEYSLNTKRTYSHSKTEVDSERMKRLKILRSILKTNAVMQEWEKGYETLKKENDKLETLAKNYKVRNCYEAYHTMRQLLIVREKLVALNMSHQAVREFQQGIVLKFRKMALKNTLMAHRLYENCVSYYHNTSSSFCHADICYHPTNNGKKTLFGKTIPHFDTKVVDLKARKDLFSQMVFFDENEAKSLIKNFRKIMDKDDSAFINKYKEVKDILSKATKSELTDKELASYLKIELRKRRKAMNIDS